MGNRITEKDLQAVLKNINHAAGFDNPKYSEVGSYTLSGAYGGWQLQQYANEHGGIRDITSGFIPKRELYYRMQSFYAGMNHK